MRPMLGLGTSVTWVYALNYLLRNADNLLLGRCCGALALGLYSRAYQIFLLPLSQLFSPFHLVAFSTLSCMQDDPQRFRRYYCAALAALAYVSAPVIGLSILCAREIVLVFLGPQWSAAVPIFLVLSIGGVFQPVVSSTDWLFTARGEVRRQVRWAAVATPLFVLGFALGVPYGPLGVATAYAVCATVNAAGIIPYACRRAPLSARDVAGSVARPYLMAGCALLPALALRCYDGDAHLHPLAMLLGATGLTALTYAALLAVLPGARASLIFAAGSILSRRAASGDQPPGAVPCGRAKPGEEVG